MNDRMRIRTALVTAAGNGLGRSIAAQLAREGVRVALVDWEESALIDAVEAIRIEGGQAEYWVADCVAEASANATTAAVLDEFGSVDALVNNMGGSAGKDIAAFDEQRLEVIERVIEQCLLSAFRWTRALVPGMRAAGYGKVVNIASDSPYAADHHMAEYAAAKLGIVGMTRVLAQEFAEHQVAINAVAPGPTRTAAIGRVAPDVIEKAISDIPMKKLGEPQDIANAVAFFCSTHADHITGQVLMVNGGRAMA